MNQGAIPDESPRNLPEQLLLQDAKASVGKRILGSADKPLGDAPRLVANYAPNGRLEIAFEQWFTDPCFYDKLTDQEEAEVEIFEKVKELMDAEDFTLPPLDVAVEKLRETVSV